MEYSYKFRLYPTATQQEQMARNFGCCRYVFNHFLAQRHEQYRENGKAPTSFALYVVLSGPERKTFLCGSGFARFAVQSTAGTSTPRRTSSTKVCACWRR